MYKRRFDNPTEYELELRRQRLAEQQKQDEQQQIKQQEFLKEPNLYETVDGKQVISPQYDTSIGRDMLAGGAIGARMSNGDPYNTLGSALGGVIGGAFNKNLAGKIQYQQDVKDIREKNVQINLQTQAQIRLEAEKRQREALAQRQLTEEQKINFNQAQAQEKNRNLRIRNLQSMINSTNGEDRKYYQDLLAKEFDTTVDDYGSYGIGWTQKEYGGIIYNTAKNGSIVEATDQEGNPISDMDFNQQVDTLLKLKKLNPTNDRMTVEEAFNKADEVIKQQGFNTKFSQKTYAKEYNSLRIKLADMILDASKDGNGNVSTEVNVNGVPFKINLPMLGQPTQTPVTETQTQTETSPQIYDVTSKAPNIANYTNAGVTDGNAFNFASQYSNAEDVKNAITAQKSIDPNSQIVKALEVRLKELGETTQQNNQQNNQQSNKKYNLPSGFSQNTRVMEQKQGDFDAGFYDPVEIPSNAYQVNGEGYPINPQTKKVIKRIIIDGKTYVWTLNEGKIEWYEYKSF